MAALEGAFSTSILNEKAILDVWGGDPLQQLLGNLELQRTVCEVLTYLISATTAFEMMKTLVFMQFG